MKRRSVASGRRITHRVAGVLAACLLALGLGVAGSTPAQAAVTPPTGLGWGELYLPYFGNTDCLDIPNGSGTPGTFVQIYRCHGYASNGAPQRWTFAALFTGGYEIWNPSTLMCLTPIPGTGPGPQSSRVAEQTCGSFTGQGWNLVDDPRAPGVNFQLVNASFPTMCLTGTHGNGGLVLMAVCSSASNDYWAIG